MCDFCETNLAVRWVNLQTGVLHRVFGVRRVLSKRPPALPIHPQSDYIGIVEP